MLKGFRLGFGSSYGSGGGGCYRFGRGFCSTLLTEAAGRRVLDRAAGVSDQASGLGSALEEAVATMEVEVAGVSDQGSL